MKKITAILGFLILSASVSAQSNSRFYDTEGSYKEKQAAAEADPGGGGAGGDDPVPIDDYLPALLLAGMAMAAYYARKKQVSTGS